MQQEVLPQCPQQPSNIKLEKQSEYRIYYSESYDKNLELTLVSGEAEIFGHELTQHKVYEFPPGTNFFIYTWQGCEVQTNVKDDYFYKSQNQENPNDHPLIVIANISLYLNELRKQSLEQQSIGPRVLITGKQQSGKSTVGKILVNYGCKLGWEPVLIDLDQSNNSILCGGSVAASQIKYSYPDSFVDQAQKIVYFTGQTKVDGKEFKKNIYKSSISQLSKVVFDKLNKNLEDFQQNNNLSKEQNQYSELFMNKSEQIFSSGCILNVPHFQEEVRKEMLPYIIDKYLINVIIVVGDEFQFNTLARQYHKQGITVLFCNKLGAIIDSDDRDKLLIQKNNRLLQQYFKGLNGEINCTKFPIDLNSLKLYYFEEQLRVGEINLRVKKWNTSNNLNIVKKVVGILHYRFDSEDDARQEDEDYLTEQFLQSPLMILAHFDQLSQNDTKIELLLPFNELPSNFKGIELSLHPFIIGDLNWVGTR